MPSPTSIAKVRTGGDPSRVQDNVGAVLTPLATRLNATPIMGAPPPPWIKPSIIAASGYADGGAPFAFTGYHKDALGYVHARVVLTTAAGAAANTLVFTFEQGWRPSGLMLFLGGDGGGATWETTLDQTGAFKVVTATAAGDLVVTSFSFLAEA